MLKIICVCGARPNFMKIAPIMRAFKESGRFELESVIHSDGWRGYNGLVDLG